MKNLEDSLKLLNISLIEDCIPEKTQEEYLHISKTMNWSYNTTTLHPFYDQVETENVYDVGQLSCKIDNSGYYQFAPLLSYFGEYKEINRIKFNLLWRCKDSNNRHNGVHEDQNGNYLTGLYYVKDSDGDTFIFNEGVEYRFTPKKGALLLFPSNLSHASSNPSKSYDRIVINMVVRVK